jgi:hypothetical protein
MSGDSVLSINRDSHGYERDRKREREKVNGDKKGAYICDYTLCIKRHLSNQTFFYF